jgi:transcriptional regulator with XRE-family HTH domain
MSQQSLATAAAISTRHLSFVETGRAQPSAEVMSLLCSALHVPPRERNALLQAAGFAPRRRGTDLTDPALAEMRHALELILKRQEPFVAVVLDGRWDIVMVNRAFAGFLAALDHTVTPYAVTAAPRLNWLRLLFEPGEIRRVIVNWAEVAGAIRLRVAREDPELARTLGAGIPAPEGDGLVVPVRLRLGQKELRLFSTVSSLGTALDVTLQELKIDSFHPFEEPVT